MPSARAVIVTHYESALAAAILNVIAVRPSLHSNKDYRWTYNFELSLLLKETPNV